ncbi:MAG: two-component system, OmpR family, phosphate regulon sensor histidine kinase PhoR, partial [Thermomicrobiales bacterium]|nr:two-component system, OmpR family, phosphate regulon sensor histidine kinase PhoR [Thermomicrobiales bacterium]
MQFGATVRPTEPFASRGPARPAATRSSPTSTAPTPPSSTRSPWLLLGLAGGVVAAWAAAALETDRAYFILESRTLGTGVLAAIVVTRLTAAFILFAYPDDRLGPRLRWIGVGILVQAIGTIAFHGLLPYVAHQNSRDQSRYGLVVVSLISAGLFIIGLAPAHPPRLSRRFAAVVAILAAIPCLVVSWDMSMLPPLYRADIPDTLQSHRAPFEYLTAWYGLLAGLTIALIIAAAVLTIRRLPAGRLQAGLAIAFVLLAGAQLQYAVWPFGSSSGLTSTSLLRLASTIAVAAGVLLELRRYSADRTVRLAAKRARIDVLDAAVARSTDLGAVVAHELRSPIATIRNLADILDLPDLDPVARRRTVNAIRSETAVLGALAEDIQTLGAVEQHLFTVAPFSVDLGLLIAETVGFARALPGNHPFTWPQTLTGRVAADPERIIQVLRNLLTNAAKYSPPGTPIEIRAHRHDHHIRVAVVDHGPGIDPADATRIFEMFDRGCGP